MRVTQAQDSLTLEIHPYLAATELIDRFTHLANYLTQKTGRPVTVTIAGDYQEHIDQIGNDMEKRGHMGGKGDRFIFSSLVCLAFYWIYISPRRHNPQGGTVGSNIF